MSRFFPYVLILVKAGLLIWGVLGFWEYVVPSAGFGLQNAGFPPGTQFLHWLLITLTGSIFVVGFLLRWQHTPFATVTMYATLATLCFIETIDFGAFGGPPQSLFVMGGEFATYLAISFYLLRSRHIRNRFGKPR